MHESINIIYDNENISCGYSIFPLSSVCYRGSKGGLTATFVLTDAM